MMTRVELRISARKVLGQFLVKNIWHGIYILRRNLKLEFYMINFDKHIRYEKCIIFIMPEFSGRNFCILTGDVLTPI